MSDFSSISSSSLANLSISKALYGKEKDDAGEKKSALHQTEVAKNSFMGRITNRILSSQPSKIGQAIRQVFYAAIGHLLKPGALSRIFENAINPTRNDKPLSARAISVPPENLGSWHELETLQSQLSQLKGDLQSIHEQNQQNFKTSTADITDTRSMAALKEGYPKEAELKSKVQEQEKKVADFEKRLSEQKHVPAFPIKPRPPAKSESMQAVAQPVESRKNYQLPTALPRGESDNLRPSAASAPTLQAAVTPSAAPPLAQDASAAAPSAEAASAPGNSAITAKQINTSFDYSALKPASTPLRPGKP